MTFLLGALIYLAIAIPVAWFFGACIKAGRGE